MTQSGPRGVGSDTTKRDGPARLPILERGKALRRQAANDNSSDWRSLLVRYAVRPVRRLVAILVSLVAMIFGINRS